MTTTELISRGRTSFGRPMGDAPLAARCAFWLCMMLRNKGEFARAGG